jgi:hypothetical protein
VRCSALDRSPANVEGGSRRRASFGIIDTANRYRRRFYVVCSLENAGQVPERLWFIVSGCRVWGSEMKHDCLGHGFVRLFAQNELLPVPLLRR